MRIAIIGGGIAGLAAAYELEKARESRQHRSNTRSLKRGRSWAARWPRRSSTARCSSAGPIRF